jgi:hypothetical protein
MLSRISLAFQIGLLLTGSLSSRSILSNDTLIFSRVRNAVLIRLRIREESLISIYFLTAALNTGSFHSSSDKPESSIAALCFSISKYC